MDSPNDNELLTVFSKLLNLLNLRFGRANVCKNCCQKLENISQQLQVLQDDVRKLQQVVCQGFEDTKSDMKEKGKKPNELPLNEADNESTSTEDEITGFSQEQTFFSPNGSFPKRFSAGSPKGEQNARKDIVAPEQRILPTKNNSKEDFSKLLVESTGSLPCDTWRSEYAKPNSSTNEESSLLTKENNDVLGEPKFSEDRQVKQKKTTEADISKFDSKSDITTTKTETPETRQKHKGRKEDTSQELLRQRKVARGQVNSQNFGKVSRVKEDKYGCVSFSQTPSPKKETVLYEIRENSGKILEHLPAENKSPKVKIEYKDNNGNNLCANPVIRSKEERMRIRGSACTECQKTWSCLAHNDEERCKEMIQKYSRHRHCYTPPETPEFWFDISFPETETIPPESPLV